MYEGLSSGAGPQVTETAESQPKSPRSRSGKAVLPRSSFDHEYVSRLRSGDPETERHFTEYFGELLLIKLRARIRHAQTIEDIRQETFLRVLTALKKKNSLQSPECLGSFVNSVANNLLLEMYRKESRQKLVEQDEDFDPPDHQASAESEVVTEERKRQVLRVLDELPGKDRDLLRMVFYDEVDPDEICKIMGANRGYLRVLLHRAKARFRECMLKG